MITRASRFLLPTLKDDPADAEAVSHRLLVRAGYVRQVGSGLYTFLPLGWKVMQRIAAILREEMDALGMEVSMPVLNPAELWRETHDTTSTTCSGWRTRPASSTCWR